VVAGVEGGLAAADLSARDLDLESGGPEEGGGVLDHPGKDELPEAGGEELYALGHCGEPTN
jgi:hypothetical protein